MDDIYLYEEGACVILDIFSHHYENVGLKFCRGLTTMKLNFREWIVQGIIMDVKSPAPNNLFSLILKDTSQQASA